MGKRQEAEIKVRVIFSGKQTDREAFINLILEKERGRDSDTYGGRYCADTAERRSNRSQRWTQDLEPEYGCQRQTRTRPKRMRVAGP